MYVETIIEQKHPTSARIMKQRQNKSFENIEFMKRSFSHAMLWFSMNKYEDYDWTNRSQQQSYYKNARKKWNINSAITNIITKKKTIQWIESS